MQWRARKQDGQQHGGRTQPGQRAAHLQLGIHAAFDRIDGEHQPGGDGQRGRKAEARFAAHEAVAQDRSVQ